MAQDCKLVSHLAIQALLKRDYTKSQALGKKRTENFYFSHLIFRSVGKVWIHHSLQTSFQSTQKLTSWKTFWSHKLFEEFICCCHLVIIVSALHIPELQFAAFLQKSKWYRGQATISIPNFHKKVSDHYVTLSWAEYKTFRNTHSKLM